MSDVKCLTMKGSLQTIMAQVSDGTHDFEVVLKNPVMIIVIPPRTAGESSSVGIVPFLNYTVEYGTGITFHRADILTMTTPMTDLLNQYNSIFGSGIVLASSLTSS